jgi:hypothetical protein
MDSWAPHIGRKSVCPPKPTVMVPIPGPYANAVRDHIVPIVKVRLQSYVEERL